MPELAFAVDYGVDIQALIVNLNRPVTERIRRHQIALDTFKKLRKKFGAKFNIQNIDVLIEIRKMLNHLRNKNSIIPLEAIKKIQKNSEKHSS